MITPTPEPEPAQIADWAAKIRAWDWDQIRATVATQFTEPSRPLREGEPPSGYAILGGVRTLIRRENRHSTPAERTAQVPAFRAALRRVAGEHGLCIFEAERRFFACATLPLPRAA